MKRPLASRSLPAKRKGKELGWQAINDLLRGNNGQRKEIFTTYLVIYQFLGLYKI